LEPRDDDAPADAGANARRRGINFQKAAFAAGVSSGVASSIYGNTLTQSGMPRRPSLTTHPRQQGATLGQFAKSLTDACVQPLSIYTTA